MSYARIYSVINSINVLLNKYSDTDNNSVKCCYGLGTRLLICVMWQYSRFSSHLYTHYLMPIDFGYRDVF